MPVTVPASLDYNDATLRSTHTRVIPAAATTERRVLVVAGIGSGSRVLTARLTHADGTTRDLTAWPKASVTGHASHVWEFAADSKTAGATLTIKVFLSDGVTASSERLSITVTVRAGAGAPHKFASTATSTGGTTKTVPQVIPDISDTVPVLIALDTEGGTAPTTPTTVWSPPSSAVTLDADDFPPTTEVPVPTHVVAGAYGSAVPVGQASPAYVFTADNSAIGSAWTILYPVLPTEVPKPASMHGSGYNDATARVTHSRVMPPQATAGRRVLVPMTIASGARVLAATLVHADGTTRTVSELAPKAGLTNGGHAQYAVEFECDAKTAGARLDLYQRPADTTQPDSEIKASIPLIVLEGVLAPLTAQTVGHSSASSTKKTPAVTPGAFDTVEVSLVSDSRGGTSPVTSTATWVPPEGFTLLAADYMAGTTASPVSTSAIGARLGVRLRADTPAGQRTWTSKDLSGANIANVGATWTVIYPVAKPNVSGMFVVVADGFVPLDMLFPDTLTTPGAPVQASPATGVTATGFTSSWSAASSADTYLVQRRTGTNAFATVATVTTTSYTHTGLAASTAYDVRVIGVNSGTVQGPASNTVSTTTTA